MIFFILACLVFFLVTLSSLTGNLKISGTVKRIIISCVVLGGTVIYGYGYWYVMPDGNIPMALVRAVLATARMFVGVNDLSSVQSAPLFSNQIFIVIFWLLHLLGFYTTASAALTSVGADAVKRMKMILTRRGNISVIFGVNDHTLSLGQQILAGKDQSVVFVDRSIDAGALNTIGSTLATARTEKIATDASVDFFKSIGISKTKQRKINIFCLSSDRDNNLQFAGKALSSLKAMGINPKFTKLTVRGVEDSICSQLMNREENYGFGNVNTINNASLAARLLINRYPPCNTIKFDENGKAEENFEAIVVGFGKLGKEVLKQLIMNGQFEGSKFSASVFTRDYEEIAGFFSSSCKNLTNNYDINFFKSDARSIKMYEYLKDHASSLNYIAVCTGNDKMNAEIEAELTRYLRNLGCKAEVYQCSYSGVRNTPKGSIIPEITDLYKADIICDSRYDKMAMELNHCYCSDSEKSAEEDWAQCDYFSRMSSRASADFVPSMLKAIGLTEDEVKKNGLTLSDEAIEVLGRTEHLRWCAFHNVMGYVPMSREEFIERAENYKREKEANGFSRYPVSKDRANKKHACLVPWEELDELSEIENSITGKSLDYKKMDINNVLLIPDLLRAEKQ